MRCYVHTSRGRLRVSMPSLKSSPENVDSVLRTVSSLPGIQQATFNPITGSLLVFFDFRATSCQAIQERLSQEGWIEGPPVNGSSLALDGAYQKVGEKLGEQLFDLAVKKVLELGISAIL